MFIAIIPLNAFSIIIIVIIMGHGVFVAFAHAHAQVFCIYCVRFIVFALECALLGSGVQLMF